MVFLCRPPRFTYFVCDALHWATLMKWVLFPLIITKLTDRTWFFNHWSLTRYDVLKKKKKKNRQQNIKIKEPKELPMDLWGLCLSQPQSQLQPPRGDKDTSPCEIKTPHHQTSSNHYSTGLSITLVWCFFLLLLLSLAPIFLPVVLLPTFLSQGGGGCLATCTTQQCSLALLLVCPCGFRQSNTWVCAHSYRMCVRKVKAMNSFHLISES